MTYGVQAGLYGNNGDFGTVFLGQSRRFEEDDDLFPAGSGLDDQSSDVVGQVQAQYGTNFNLDYRFQLADESLASERQEVDLSARLGRITLDTAYLFAKALEGTDIDESREQINGSMLYNAVSYTHLTLPTKA